MFHHISENYLNEEKLVRFASVKLRAKKEIYREIMNITKGITN